MKSIYIIFCLLLIAVSTKAQTITVIDKINNEPLTESIVQGNDKTILLKTDSKGQVDISSLKKEGQITFTRIGYTPVSYNFSDLEQMKYTVSISKNPYLMEEVVVSAARFKEKKSDVPRQIDVLKGKDIEFVNQSTSADLMQSTGNILVQKSQLGGGSPIIRGFEANKVLIVVDGVRMNNAIFRGGHLQNIITMDNSMLEKTEILYGPGSVVYGSDALGGVMHFYTKNPMLGWENKY
jgi:hemoglobin/transferrin/lactoferrin receptor protein